MKDYFSHDYYARNDTELVKIFMKYGLTGIGAYWCIIEMLYEEGGYLKLTEYDRITFELRTDYDLIKDIIENSNLFKFDDKKFWSETAIERLKMRAEKSEKARKSIEKRWKKYERITNEKQTKNKRNTSKVKESKIKKSKEKIYIDKFEIFRQKYPGTKRGLDTEFENLQKKHKNWKEIIELLTPNLERQIEERKKINGFVPEWKHLQTYINQNGWELEYKQGQQQSLKKEYKP